MCHPFAIMRWCGIVLAPVRTARRVVGCRGMERTMPETNSQIEPLAPTGCHAPTLTEQERKRWLDHEWVLCDPAIQCMYAGAVVAVADRIVLGVGPTHLAALQAALARPDC